jgi:hypothetical protein
MVQEAFGRDPHAGDLWVFRGRRGDLIEIGGDSDISLARNGRRHGRQASARALKLLGGTSK